jgi:hypothetical protein
MGREMKLLALILGVFLLFGSSGCVGGKAKVSWPQDDLSGYPAVAGVQKTKGPPPHAPAHGYRAQYGYHYYPAAYVYYDTQKRIYFFLEDGKWIVAADLPAEIRLRLGDSVTIQLETDRPYIHFAEHLVMYPSKQYKKNKPDGKKKRQ